MKVETFEIIKVSLFWLSIMLMVSKSDKCICLFHMNEIFTLAILFTDVTVNQILNVPVFILEDETSLLIIMPEFPN